VKPSLGLLGLLLVTTATSGLCPPQVVKVLPSEGATSAQVDTIGATLNFQKGERADPASLQLFVDGVDVTAESRRAGTGDWPPSHWEISYPAAKLRPGVHQAEVRFRTEAGGALQCAWTFTITRP
jgi:hypothetical protein